MVGTSSLGSWDGHWFNGWGFIWIYWWFMELANGKSVDSDVQSMVFGAAGNHFWLVVDLPLWKMMEWKSVGMMIPFPIWWESHNPAMFQSAPPSWRFVEPTPPQFGDVNIHPKWWFRQAKWCFHGFKHSWILYQQNKVNMLVQGTHNHEE